ncbi:MAG: CPBP family intramembrane glutamic endopeptidase [Pyrinomonadaceae bacterium]
MQELNQENYENTPRIFSGETAEKETPTPNNPPWNSIMAVGLWVASVVFILILPSLFLLPYLLRQNIPLANNPELGELIMRNPTAIAISLGGTMFAHLLTIVLAWAIITNFRKYSFTEMVGWKPGGIKLWLFLILAFFGILALAFALTNLLGAHDNEMTKILKSSRTAVYLVAILATFSAPFVEEVVYRGVLYSAFQRTFNVPVAVIVVTLLFALVHVPQYTPDYAAIISICTLSLLLTLVRAKTDSLLPCILFHMFFNGFQSVLLILEPYLALPDSLEQLPEKTSSAIVHLIHLISAVNLYL